MRTACSIIEDTRANVLGVETDQGPVYVLPEHVVPRAQLGAAARSLATLYGVTIPPEWMPALPPAPVPNIPAPAQD